MIINETVRSADRAPSLEMISKLVRAGYLLPALCDSADAVAHAIAAMKRDLRGATTTTRKSHDC
jgi:hypothetical protein